ncbi:MAG: cation diffusion facilitator family transporter [Hyphomonas sp.]|nr:cation diffusion facilitator family transporter [Hyphomonas sp.]
MTAGQNETGNNGKTAATRRTAHGHAGHLPSSGRALTVSAWLTGIYFVIELIVGLWTGSVAVISDAFHTFSAVGGVLVAIIAAQIALRPADMRRTFGWYRAEIVGALVNGAFLLVMALVVIVMGVMRLGAPIDLPTTPMLLVATGGLVTEVIALYMLYRQQGSDLNVRGAYWHIIQTFIGSLIIIVAALVIEFTGFLAIDPLLGIAFGFVLLWASWSILRDAVHLLMDGTPDEVSLQAVIIALETLDGVGDVHHVHSWALTSGRYVFSAHLRVRPHWQGDPGALLKTAHALLRDRFNFFFVTLQVETMCLDEVAAAAINVAGGEAETTSSNRKQERKQ